MVYKYYKGSRKPLLKYKNMGKPDAFDIIKKAGIDKLTYKPSFLMFNGVLQTLHVATVGAIVKPPKYDNEIFEFGDGGHTELDWLVPEGNIKGVLAILPGITGNSKAPYVIYTIKQAISEGYIGVVINYRSKPGIEPGTPKSYCAASSWDCKEVMEHITKKYPGYTLNAIGYSMGANVLTKYLGEESEHSVVARAVCVASPID